MNYWYWWSTRSLVSGASIMRVSGPVFEIVALGISHRADMAVLTDVVDLMGERMAWTEVAHVFFSQVVPPQDRVRISHVGGV